MRFIARSVVCTILTGCAEWFARRRAVWICLWWILWVVSLRLFIVVFTEGTFGTLEYARMLGVFARIALFTRVFCGLGQRLISACSARNAIKNRIVQRNLADPTRQAGRDSGYNIGLIFARGALCTA